MSRLLCCEDTFLGPPHIFTPSYDSEVDIFIILTLRMSKLRYRDYTAL